MWAGGAGGDVSGGEGFCGEVFKEGLPPLSCFSPPPTPLPFSSRPLPKPTVRSHKPQSHLPMTLGLRPKR